MHFIYIFFSLVFPWMCAIHFWVSACSCINPMGQSRDLSQWLKTLCSSIHVLEMKKSSQQFSFFSHSSSNPTSPWGINSGWLPFCPEKHKLGKPLPETFLSQPHLVLISTLPCQRPADASKTPSRYSLLFSKPQHLSFCPPAASDCNPSQDEKQPPSYQTQGSLGGNWGSAKIRWDRWRTHVLTGEWSTTYPIGSVSWPIAGTKGIFQFGRTQAILWSLAHCDCMVWISAVLADLNGSVAPSGFPFLICSHSLLGPHQNEQLWSENQLWRVIDS